MLAKATVEVKAVSSSTFSILQFSVVFFHFEGPMTMVHDRKVKLLGLISFGTTAGKATAFLQKINLPEYKLYEKLTS